MTSLIVFLIPTSVLLSNIIFLIFVILFLLSSKFRKKSNDIISSHILYIVFTLSLFSVLGSIVYSDILNFPPCELCWYQRIFIYPQAVLSFLAILKKDKSIISYLLPLSILGFFISLYQSYVQWGGESLLPCTANGAECSKLYVYEYGYITIPFMALSAFIYLLTVSFVYKRNNN